MDDLLLFVFIFSGVMTCFGFIYLCIKIPEQYRSYKRRVSFCNQLNLQVNFSELFVDLVKRTFVFYYSYAIQNTLAILCNLFSLIFSIIAFIKLIDNQINNIISLLAIIFVVIAIYVKPHLRSMQYLRAWLKMDKLVLSTIGKLRPTLSDADLDDLFNSIGEQRRVIEFSITADTD